MSEYGPLTYKEVVGRATKDLEYSKGCLAVFRIATEQAKATQAVMRVIHDTIAPPVDELFTSSSVGPVTKEIILSLDTVLTPDQVQAIEAALKDRLVPAKLKDQDLRRVFIRSAHISLKGESSKK